MKKEEESIMPKNYHERQEECCWRCVHLMADDCKSYKFMFSCRINNKKVEPNCVCNDFQTE